MLPKGLLKVKRSSKVIESKRSDWEVELGIVIGDKAKCVSETKAMQYIAGYAVLMMFQKEHIN